MSQAQWTAFFFVLAVLFCGVRPARAFEIGARGLYWFPTLKADVRSDSADLMVGF